MGFQFHHLGEPEVREATVELWRNENETLLAAGNRAECYGQDLVEPGWAQWERVIPEALSSHDEEWLTNQMLDPSFWRSHRTRALRSGGFSDQRISPSWVAPFLCRNEFNIAYIHGLASVLLDRGETECVVYRANAAYEPRGECTSWEGQRFATQDVFDGHRIRYWPTESKQPAAFSVPSGPNCHHSIRAVDAV